MDKFPLVAIHEIEYLDGRTKKYATPGSVFFIDANSKNKLVGRSAAREPTDAEMALYEKQNGTASRKRATADDAVEPSQGDQGGRSKQGQRAGKGKREEAPV